jgi:Transposase IS4
VEDRSGEPYSSGAGISHKDWDAAEAVRHLVVVDLYPDRGNDEGSAAHRWRLVSDFVESVNSHRAAYFSPSDLVCVDENMSRWYGQGGHWIENGLPQYVAIDRKPENGCEIQYAACGRNGIMMQLQIVTTAAHEATRASEAEAGLKHGTVVLDRLVKPWYGRGDRIVCADSYFASVEAALHLQARGVRFIGVVKTATSSYPMKLLQSKVLLTRGEWKSYVHRRDGKVAAMAVVWVEREPRYFISTASSVVEGAKYSRTRWRQLEDGAQRVTTEIKQPRVAELYCGSCAMIDRYNRCRQNDLMLERKYQIQDWSIRVNHSLLGIDIVDS